MRKYIAPVESEACRLGVCVGKMDSNYRHTSIDRPSETGT
jgi:hypothetical protein